MKKKITLVLLAVLAVTCLAITFVACNNECKQGNHDWDEGVVQKEATCAEEGERLVKCRHCGETKTVVIRKADHAASDIVIDEGTPATCQTEGLTEGKHCKKCNTVIVEQTTIPKAAHKYSVTSLGADGHAKKCSECGNAIEKEAHNFGTTYKTDVEGKHYQECSVCHYKTEAAAHASSTWHIDEATGKHYKLCDVCGTKFGEAVHAFTIDNHDTQEHWKECVCGAKDQVASHTLTWVSTDETEHWRACTGCDFTSNRAPHSVTTWEKDAAGHWKECPCGRILVEKEAHKFTIDEIECEVCHALKEGVKFIGRIGDNPSQQFETLVAALDYVKTAGESEATIIMGADITGAGIVIPENLKLTIRLTAHTYTVGSLANESCGLQIGKGATVNILNGTIKFGAETTDLANATVLVQNSANLTLTNVTLDGRAMTNANHSVLACDNGEVNLNYSNVLTTDKAGVIACALDVLYTEGAKVIVKGGEGGFTKIEGIVRYRSAVDNVTDFTNKAEVYLPLRDQGSYDVRLTNVICDVAKVYLGLGDNQRKIAHKYIKDDEKSVAATCTEAGKDVEVCAYCGHVKETPIAPLGHKTGDWIATDDTKHWKLCSVCGEKVDEANHAVDKVTGTTDTQHTGTCICGKTITENHNFVDALCVCGKISTKFDVKTIEWLLSNEAKLGDKYYVAGILVSCKDGFNSSVVIKDANGNEFTVYGVFNFDGTKRLETPLASKEFAEGNVVAFYGTLAEFNGKNQISNGWLIQVEDEHKITADKITLLETVIPAVTTKNFNLPTEGGITWAVKSGTAIEIVDNVAKVTPSSTEEFTVVLTATCGTEKRDFTVNIPTAIKGQGFVLLTKENLELGAYPGSSFDKTVSGIGFTLYKVGKYSDNIQMQNDSKDTAKRGYIFNTVAFDGRILKIEIPYTSGKTATDGNLTAAFGTSAGNYTKTVEIQYINGNAVIEAPIDCKFFRIDVVGGKGAVYIDSIKITYRDCAHDGEIVHVDAKTATCSVPGCKEHYECAECGECYSDAAGTTLMFDAVITVPHTLGKVNAQASTCTVPGHIAHYECSVCHSKFEDAAGTKLIEDVSLPKADHQMTTKHDENNHWTECSVCGGAKTAEVVHSMAEEKWTPGATQHWHVCDVCGAEYDKNNHVYGDGGACECGATNTPKFDLTVTVGEGAKVCRPNEETALTKVTVDENGTFSFKVVVEPGYTLGTVKLNGVELTATDGTYTTPAITANGEIVVTVTKNAPVTQNVTLDFLTNYSKYNSGWSSSYSKRTVNGSSLGAETYVKDVVFAAASKQNAGNSIDDCPVSKGQNVAITAADGVYFVGSVKLKLKQWTTKKIGAVSIIVTYDGGKTATINGTADVFEQTISLGSSYANITAIQIKTGNTSSQSGLVSVELQAVKG